MQSKISPFAAVAAAVAFAAAPAFALDAHLVPVPSGGVIPDAKGFSGDALPDASEGAPKGAAFPSNLPWPELAGFPRPIPGADSGWASKAGDDATTTWSTWCPEPTVFTWGPATISASTPGWYSWTECPLSSTTTASSTSTVGPVVPPHGKFHPHPFPGPEGHEGGSPEIASVGPIKPASHTVAPVAPTHSHVVVAGASKTQGFMLGVAAAGLGLAVFGL